MKLLLQTGRVGWLRRLQERQILLTYKNQISFPNYYQGSYFLDELPTSVTLLWQYPNHSYASVTSSSLLISHKCADCLHRCVSNAGQEKTQRSENKAKKKAFWKKENMVEDKKEPPLENKTSKMGKQKIKQNMKNNSKGKGRNVGRREKSKHSSQEWALTIPAFAISSPHNQMHK